MEKFSPTKSAYDDAKSCTDNAVINEKFNSLISKIDLQKKRQPTQADEPTDGYDKDAALKNLYDESV